MHFVFGAPKNAKSFQLALIYSGTDYPRVEASRHSAKALLSGLPRLPARDRDASGRHQNILKNKNPFANAQKKNPREDPEGIRYAREIGLADLRKEWPSLWLCH